MCSGATTIIPEGEASSSNDGEEPARVQGIRAALESDEYCFPDATMVPASEGYELLGGRSDDQTFESGFEAEGDMEAFLRSLVDDTGELFEETAGVLNGLGASVVPKQILHGESGFNSQGTLCSGDEAAVEGGADEVEVAPHETTDRRDYLMLMLQVGKLDV
jgi:hypothetical protein